ncbi:MAG: 6-bladed beta-propeller [Balneola sp.]|nr:6-bladed beta-propeller [Balneola sp.]
MYKTIFISFLLLSCTEVKDTDYDIYISNLSIMEHKSQSIAIASSININRVLQNSDFIIIADFRELKLYLISNDGEILDSTGREGNGPGEFLAINSIRFTDKNNEILILDSKLNRLTHYEITNNMLELKDESEIQSYQSQLFLKDIYHFNDTYYGLFKSNINIEPDAEYEKLMLYSLDENLTFKNLLLEYKYDELIEMKIRGNDYFVEHPFGFNTEWIFDKSQFIISNSKELKFTYYNLKSGEFNTYEFNGVPVINNDEGILEFLEQHYGEILSFNPNIKQDLKTRSQLPYFIKFSLYNEKIVILLSNYDTKSKELVVLNTDNNTIHIINVPVDYFMHGISDDIIYGVIKDRVYNLDQIYSIFL